MEIRFSSGNTQCGGGVVVVGGGVGGGGRYQFSARTILAFSTQQGGEVVRPKPLVCAEDKIQASESVSYL